MTTGLPTGDGGAVTVTRMEELSSPFSFWANTLDERISINQGKKINMVALFFLDIYTI